MSRSKSHNYQHVMHAWKLHSLWIVNFSLLLNQLSLLNPFTMWRIPLKQMLSILVVVDAEILQLTTQYSLWIQLTEGQLISLCPMHSPTMKFRYQIEAWQTRTGWSPQLVISLMIQLKSRDQCNITLMAISTQVYHHMTLVQTSLLKSTASTGTSTLVKKINLTTWYVEIWSNSLPKTASTHQKSSLLSKPMAVDTTISKSSLLNVKILPKSVLQKHSILEQRVLTR
jgi:hypothetical protein